MRRVRARAPLRISFAGGGTDVEPFPAGGGLVVNATIAKYVHVSARERPDDEVRVRSVDLESEWSCSEAWEQGSKHLIDCATSHLRTTMGPHGYDLFIRSDVPPGSGVGASSALVVAVVAAVARLHSKTLNRVQLVRTAYRIEREIAGIKGGWQDYYAASYGGFNAVEFPPPAAADPTEVRPIDVSLATRAELEHNLVLVWTGETRAGEGIIEDQVKRNAVDAFAEQKKLARKIEVALIKDRPQDLGPLLHHAWESKQKMSPKIATQTAKDLYRTGREAGVAGGKLVGAGGGGFMLLCCEYERKGDVIEAMEAASCPVEPVTFQPNGVQTWEISDG
ncbi:MAG: GHMP kinase [Actinomycetota bacterium]|nr:GHMP kinase [Actinomycetota bacterium]